jgi:hypothetical protein
METLLLVRPIPKPPIPKPTIYVIWLYKEGTAHCVLVLVVEKKRRE